jgi:succinylglutamate desuccinylase
MTLALPKKIERLIGQMQKGKGGPLLIVSAGIHGNEPAGLLALQELLRELEAQDALLNGRIVALAGNLEGLRRGERFIHRDLNRLWELDQVHHVQAMPKEHLHAEYLDLREMADIIDEALESPHGDFMFLDIHTTSAKGGVFSFCNRIDGALEMAKNTHVPVISNITERLKGTSINYFEERGLAAMGFEAGQNAEPEAVHRAIAAIFIVMEKMGMVDASKLEPYQLFREALNDYAKQLPSVVDLCYRHPVRINDGFLMREGFGNFQPVKQNDLLAEDNHGAIRAKEDGLILMPLYQSQGTDGFFIVKEVS